MRFYSVILLFLTIPFFSGCDQSNQSKNPPEIVSRDSDTVFNEIPGQHHLGRIAYELSAAELLENVRKANKYLEAIDKYGLRDTLEAVGPYTVIAFSDAAYDVNDTTNNNSSQDIPETEEFVKSLILQGNIDADNLTEGPVTRQNLNGDSVVIALDNGVLKINDNTYPAAEAFTVTNGVVYELNEWKE